MKGKKRIFSLITQGNSMYPLLQNGDIVEYVRASLKTVNINDIILTYVNHNLITHRVIYVSKEGYVTRGDNNIVADPMIKKGRILAKVQKFKRTGIQYDIQDVYKSQSTLYLHEIQKLVKMMRQQKILHTFLKGVLVSLRYEGSIPKRIYADCDLLTERSEYQKMLKIYRDLGYTLIQEQPTSFSSSIKLDKRSEISFIRFIHNVPIIFDIHFEPVFLLAQLEGMGFIFPKKRLMKMGRDFIKRSEEIKIKDFRYSLCAVPDQILYLSLHIFNHNFTDSVRYQLLYSIVKKSATTKVFQQLVRTILEHRLEGYVYPVFLLLNTYYKNSVPSSFMHSIAPSSFKLKIAHEIVKNTNIFSQDSRDYIKIIYAFLLSPEPFLYKILIFIHPETIRAVFWVIRRKCNFLLNMHIK